MKIKTCRVDTFTLPTYVMRAYKAFDIEFKDFICVLYCKVGRCILRKMKAEYECRLKASEEKQNNIDLYTSRFLNAIRN